MGHELGWAGPVAQAEPFDPKQTGATLPKPAGPWGTARPQPRSQAPGAARAKGCGIPGTAGGHQLHPCSRVTSERSTAGLGLGTGMGMELQMVNNRQRQRL